MHFANPLPWWFALLVAAAIGGAAVLSYRRTLAPLTAVQRGVLIGLRVLALGSVVLFLCRPIVLAPSTDSSGVIVPILVDASQSMRIADAEGRPRLTRAVEIVKSSLLPALSKRLTAEIYGVGDGLVPSSIDALTADGRQSDLVGALEAVRDRYRGRRVSGVVLISDGGDTGQHEGAAQRDPAGLPVFTIGVGSAAGLPDREVLGLAAGDPRLDQASIDLHVSASSRGFGRAPFDLRILANGKPVDVRRVVPAADGSPIDAVFTVSPDPGNPTIYTADIPAAADEALPQNNARSVLVGPPGRKRRILVLEGAPGFEHSFLTRALAEDPSLEIDSVVRKGKNDAGQDTFFVQAGTGRAAALTTGFPARREDLYVYDALIVANVEGDFFKRAQLGMIAEFVAERGGGLLVLGGRSFGEHGLVGTPLEPALPVELGDRRNGLVRSAFGADLSGPHNTVALTADGERHPVMRLAPSGEETRRRWAALPPLSSSAPLGGPKPGATILAVTAVAGGAVYPVVAVQQYGRGRSMVFGGEAAWRWRMLLPATDRSYEFFWRQAVRWLAAPAPDAVAVTVPDSAQAGDAIEVGIEARDAAFEPVSDAQVSATMTVPGGESRALTVRREGGTGGRFAAAVRADANGLYRVHVDAKRGTASLGAIDRWFYVGGFDREMADPRLNEALLRRLATASGGRFVRADGVSQLVAALEEAVAERGQTEQRDLWQEPWAFALVIAVLSAEWILRRRWGLR